jgi:hypothetical protein
MKTAVELLAIQLKKNHGIDLTLYDEFNEAKELEKKQMHSDFWYHRRITGYEILKDKVESFKQQEQ